MKDQDMTREQLIGELGELRQQIAKLKTADTERQQSEEALRRSEATLKSVFRAAPIGIGLVVDRVFQWTNDALHRMVGYSADELRGKNARMLYPSDEEYERVGREKYAEIADRGTGAIETHFQCKDGSVIDVLLSSTPLDPTDLLAGVTFTALDISERKRTEEALRESEERFRQMAEDSRDVFWMRDLKSLDLLYITPAYERLWGQSIEDAHTEPTSWMRNVHPEDRDRIAAAFERQARGEPTENEYRVVWPDGPIRWIRDRVFPIYDEVGEAYRLVGVVEDVTERKRAEDALQESEQRFRQMAEGIREVFWMTEPKSSRILYVSPAYESIWQRSIEDLYEDPRAWMAPIHPDDVATVSASWEEQVQGISTYEEFRITRPDGSTRWIENRSYPIVSEGGQVRFVTGVAEDITERKRAEELIRTQRDLGMALGAAHGLEETLRLCFKAAIRVSGMDCGGVYLVDDASGDVELVFHQGLPSEFIERASHYDADSPNARLVMAGEPFYVRHHELAMPLDDRVCREGLRALAVIPVHHEDQVIACLNVASHTLDEVPDSARAALETVATQIGSAITHSKAQEALHQSQTNLQMLFDSLEDFLFVLDMQGRILRVNPAVVKRLGYSEDELLGESVLKVHPPDRHEEAAAIVADMVASRTDSCSVPMAAMDGTQIPVETRIVQGRWDDQKALFGISSDITDRKRAEEERNHLLAHVQEQARRVQQIMDTVPEGVLLLNAAGQVILANPLGEKDLVTLAGAKVGDVLTQLGDRPLAELLDSPRARGLWHEVATNGRSFQVIARPIEAGATPGGWVLVIRDVTQQREIQQRIEQQERLAAVGQLAAGIAHDFNNIMATVILYAQMTARMEGLPATVRERMETIDGQAKHATKLIQQILDFSRRAVLERRPLDLVPLLKEHVRLLERTLPESIEIKLDHELDEYVVNADPTRMQQMVTNLALNAREAMQGGGELRIGLERINAKPGESPPLLEMETGEWVKLTVSDTGTGIPTDVLPHIFEPFFTTRAPLGSGLGLAQVHGIVGAHEGHIDVQSQVDQGTTFTIYLPMHAVKPSPVRSRAELPALTRGQRETILVVEDDAAVRKALTDSLELLNYQVLEVTNGQEALEMLEQRRGEVALVLSDVVMPHMGGIALLHALRERGLVVPLVMLSGHPVRGEMEKLRAQGMADWLSKPPQLDELAKAVARALGAD